MRIDEAGHDYAAPGVDDLRVRLGLRVFRRPGEFDLRVFAERDAVFDHATRRYNRAAYNCQTICHIKIPCQKNLDLFTIRYPLPTTHYFSEESFMSIMAPMRKT